MNWWTANWSPSLSNLVQQGFSSKCAMHLFQFSQLKAYKLIRVNQIHFLDSLLRISPAQTEEVENTHKETWAAAKEYVLSLGIITLVCADIQQTRLANFWTCETYSEWDFVLETKLLSLNMLNSIQSTGKIKNIEYLNLHTFRFSEILS